MSSQYSTATSISPAVPGPQPDREREHREGDAAARLGGPLGVAADGGGGDGHLRTVPGCPADPDAGSAGAPVSARVPTPWPGAPAPSGTPAAPGTP